MDYKTFLPSPSLASFVKCFWTLESPSHKSVERQKIVPDGCMEMIFHYGDLFYQFVESERYIIQPRAFVFGQITKTLEIAPSGKTGIIAVRFFPEGFIPFGTIEIRDMDNRAVSLEELYGEKGLSLQNEVFASATTEARIKKIESFLLSRLTSMEGVNALAKYAVNLLLESKGQITINSLAEQLQINRRQLERKFSSLIGLSPKQLAKIIRLQSVLRVMTQKTFTSLTSLAHEGGYFDQAHFIKDFKEITGYSPKQFYAGSMKMSSLFIGTE